MNLEQLKGLDKMETIALPTWFFKKLPDDQFRELWGMKGINIIISEKAAKYIDRRRRLLGLKRTGDSQFTDENAMNSRS